MIRSHVLLHCRNPRIVAGRKHTWDNKQRENVGTASELPMGTPASEGFGGLDLGRIMESGEDEDETRAARMDGWITWKHEEGG
jgi:hypothetical protein